MLVVDDDDGVRAVTVAMLRHLGHEAVEAESGAAALELLERAPDVDAMIVDLMMPNMHGAVFAVRARAIAPELPALFVTGYAGTQLFANTSSELVLRKPFRRAELAERLRGMLGSAAGAAAT